MKKLLIFFIGTLAFIPKAYAIPPPDLIINAVQSVAQVLGAMVALCMAAFFFLRDWLRAFLTQHKRLSICFLSLILLLIVGLSWWFMSSRTVLDDDSYTEEITVESVIGKERNLRLRRWKQDLLVDMKKNIELFREERSLESVSYPILSSYEPENLLSYMKTGAEDIVLLDVREEYEQAQFGLQNSMLHRYGDIVNGVMPDIPKDKTVVVICYSGIRGYVAASVLKHYGFENPTYIQGGLGLWSKQGLEHEGTDVFHFLFDKYPELSLDFLDTFEGTVASFSEFYATHSSDLPSDAVTFEVETMISQELSSRVREVVVTRKPVVLVCYSESSCFDGANVAYLLERQGVTITGFIQLEEHE